MSIEISKQILTQMLSMITGEFIYECAKVHQIKALACCVSRPMKMVEFQNAWFKILQYTETHRRFHSQFLVAISPGPCHDRATRLRPLCLKANTRVIQNWHVSYKTSGKNTEDSMCYNYFICTFVPCIICHSVTHVHDESQVGYIKFLCLNQLFEYVPAEKRTGERWEEFSFVWSENNSASSIFHQLLIQHQYIQPSR